MINPTLPIAIPMVSADRETEHGDSDLEFAQFIEWLRQDYFSDSDNESTNDDGSIDWAGEGDEPTSPFGAYLDSEGTFVLEGVETQVSDMINWLIADARGPDYDARDLWSDADGDVPDAMDLELDSDPADQDPLLDESHFVRDAERDHAFDAVLTPRGDWGGLSIADVVGMYGNDEVDEEEGEAINEWIAWELTNRGRHAGNGNIRKDKPARKPATKAPKPSSSSASSADKGGKSSSGASSSRTEHIDAAIAAFGSEEALRAAQVQKPGVDGKNPCRFCVNPKLLCFKHVPDRDGVEFADTKAESGILRMIKTLTEQYGGVADDQLEHLRRLLKDKNSVEIIKAVSKTVLEIDTELQAFKDTKSAARELAVATAVEERITAIESSTVSESEILASLKKDIAEEESLISAGNMWAMRVKDLRALEALEEKNSEIRARLMCEGIKNFEGMSMSELKLKLEDVLTTLKLRNDFQNSFIKSEEWLLANPAPPTYQRGFAICPTKFEHQSATDFTGDVFIAVNDWTIENLRPRARADGNGQILREILEGPATVPQHLNHLLRTDPHAYRNAIAHETWVYTPTTMTEAELNAITNALTRDGRATCVAYGDADVAPNYAAFEVEHTTWAPYQCACLCQDRPAGWLKSISRSFLPKIAGAMEDGDSAGFAAGWRERRHRINCPSNWGKGVVPVVLRVEVRREVISLSKVANCMHGCHIKSTHAATLASMKGAADSDFRVRDVQMLSLLRTVVDSEARLAWLMSHDKGYDIRFNVGRLRPDVWSKSHTSDLK